jgi:transposase InsO family protein
MSRKGNYYDNASMESFRGTLKGELVHHRQFINTPERSLCTEKIPHRESDHSS